jgi:hypothetical protein
MVMETTIPVSITILGHPLIQSVTLSWSANRGMVPQALLFSSEGGIAQAQLTSDNPELAMIHCHVQVNFDLAGWGIVHFEQSLLANRGGDRMVIDPGSWIHYLSLQLEIVDKTALVENTSIDGNTTSDHLVVNLVWQTTQLSYPVKLSQRMRSHQVWEIPYLCILQQDQISATISAFGMINRQIVRLKSRSLPLGIDQLGVDPLAVDPSTKLLLHASSREIQLVNSTVK